MKRAVIVIIAVVLISAIALAETDFSSMSYDELVEINRKITAEIMSRPEWTEVTVEPGEWIVGVDIPAGVYSVHPSYRSANFACYDENGRMVVNIVTMESHPIGKVELKEGWVVKPNKAVIFSPPMTLGF